MEEQNKEVKTTRLKEFEKKLLIIKKTKAYLEKEILKIRDKETKMKEKIMKEKQAISLVNKAKKLRSSKKE